jgi:hypothetical protein
VKVTLSELGSLGELVGGIAVIGSLIYLAIQVRHATQSQRTESFLSGLVRVNDWYRSISNNGDLARIYLDGCADFAELNREERARFHALIMEVLVVCEMMYRLGQGQLLNAPTLSAVSSFISGLFRNPGIVTWWQEQGRSAVTEDFREYVDRVAAA